MGCSQGLAGAVGPRIPVGLGGLAGLAGLGGGGVGIHRQQVTPVQEPLPVAKVTGSPAIGSQMRVGTVLPRQSRTNEAAFRRAGAGVTRRCRRDQALPAPAA